MRFRSTDPIRRDPARSNRLEATSRRSGIAESQIKLLVSNLEANKREMFLKTAVGCAADMVASLPEPVYFIEELRAQRVYERDLTAKAILYLRRRAELPLVIMMADLSHSKRLEAVASANDVDFLEEIIAPFHAQVRRLARVAGGVFFNNPHGDDFQLFFSSVSNAGRFASRLYADAANMSGRIAAAAQLDEELLVIVPKIGLVSVNSYDHAEVQRKIHSCSLLISSSPPAENGGHLLVGIPLSDIPDSLARLAVPHTDMAGIGVVLRLERERLAGLMGE